MKEDTKKKLLSKADDIYNSVVDDKLEETEKHINELLDLVKTQRKITPLSSDEIIAKINKVARIWE